MFVFVLGRVVFHMPDWLHHVLSAGRILFKKTLEAYMDQYLQYKLDQILQEHRLVSLITLLRGLFIKLTKNIQILWVSSVDVLFHIFPWLTHIWAF